MLVFPFSVRNSHIKFVCGYATALSLSVFFFPLTFQGGGFLVNGHPKPGSGIGDTYYVARQTAASETVTKLTRHHPGPNRQAEKSSKVA